MMRPLLVAALLTFTVRAAAASCGHDLCPDPARLVGGVLPLSFDVDFRSAGFHLPYSSGEYRQIVLKGDMRLGRWALGGAAPYLVVLSDQGNPSGFGNASLYAERRIFDLLPISLGVQAELPGSKARQGLSSDRAELLPYAATAMKLGPIVAGGRVGYRTKVGGSFSNAGNTPLLVEPHGERELLYRGSASFNWAPKGLLPEVYLTGQQGLKGAGAGKAFLSAGTSFETVIGSVFALRPFLEYPLTKPQRSGLRAGVATSIRLPFTP